MGVVGVPLARLGSSGDVLMVLVILMVGLFVGGGIGILLCELFGFVSKDSLSGEKEYPNVFLSICAICGIPLVFYVMALLFGNK